MKSGRSIQELAGELDRRSQCKRDFLANTNALSAYVPLGGEGIRLAGLHKTPEEYRDMPCGINTHALRQIGAHQNIPAKYVDRMLKESPELLATNINHWFQAEPARRLVRTNEHGVRAFLSDRYRIIDNEDIAEMVLPALSDIPDLNIMSCEVTDKKLYIKAVTPRISGEVVVGQAVQAGVMISNSEVGMGSVKVTPFAYFLWCLNGCATDRGLSKYHIGRASDGTDQVREVMSDEALAADDKALMLKLRDVLKASVDQVHFDKSLNKFREAQKIDIGDPMEAIETIEKKGWLSKDEGKSVLKHLIEGADLSAFGLSSAITRASQDFESYDRASELEELGGTVIDLPRSEWQPAALAA